MGSGIDLTDVRDEFPLVSASGAPIYFDNAATAHKPREVLEAMTNFYLTANSNIGRGFHDLAFAATEQYENARAAVAKFVGAAAECLVFTPGTTSGINLVADRFVRPRVEAGDRIVVTALEHNSNLLPWRRLCEEHGLELVVVDPEEDGSILLSRFAQAVSMERVRFASLAHVSNVLGTLNPVRDMVEAAHRSGVPVLIDGAQAAPHLPLDMASLGPDFYVFSGHKAYGPQGIGVLYVNPDLLQEIPPFHVGGGTVKEVSRDEPVSYVPAPGRLEAGTENVAGAIGLAAACGFLDRIGMAAVEAHSAQVGEYAVKLLTDVDRVRVIGGPDAGQRGIVSFVVDGIHPYDVGSHLNQAGVAMRCGVHCANTFLDELRLLGTVRLSFGVYNTFEEVEVAVEAVKTVAAGVWTKERPTVRF